MDCELINWFFFYEYVLFFSLLMSINICFYVFMFWVLGYFQVEDFVLYIYFIYFFYIILCKIKYDVIIYFDKNNIEVSNLSFSV